MNYSIIRCICALVIGVLLVAWPEAAILYLVITIGVLFLVPGLFSLSGYLIRGKQDGSRFPIAGLGSLLFGLWLMIMPAFFVGILMYVLGAVLVLAGISQIVNLSAARSWTVVPGGFFVIPVLVLIAGIVVLFNPFRSKLSTYRGYCIKELKDGFRSLLVLKNRFGASDVAIGVGFYGRCGIFKELPSASEINDYDKYKNPDWTIIDFPDREVEIERTKKDDLRVTITL